MGRANQEQGLSAAFKHQLSQRFAECALLVSFGSAMFMLLSLLTYHRHDSGWSTLSNNQAVHNMAGEAGAWVADLLLAACGYVAFILPPMFVVWAWLYWQGVRNEVHYFKQNHWTTIVTRVLSFLLILLASAGLFSLYLPNSSHLPFSAGGLIGDVISFGLIHQLGLIGVSLALLTILFSAITVYSGLSWLWVADSLGRLIWQGSKALYGRITCHARSFVLNIRQRFYKLGQRVRHLSATSAPKQSEPSERSGFVLPPATEVHEQSELKPQLAKSQAPYTAAAGNTEAVAEPSEPVVAHASAQQSVPETTTLPPRSSAKVKNAKTAKPKAGAIMPTLALLDQARASNNTQLTHQYLESMSAAVESHLKDFGVVAQVVAAYPGPVVTRFELQLAAGTKASKVSGLAKDIARSLSVKSVRVAEIIPGKSVIGLELPNLNRETVVLSEILGSQEYLQSKSAVTLALGKDIAGHPIVVDLAKMPHLLVAGTTGSGKSVGLNAILMSLLFKSSPEELRLILIDPKMLELAIYEGIPHLLTPVVTDMKDAASVLRWCVAEMERRYRLMAAVGVRNLAGFNAKIKQAKKDKQPILDPTWEVGPDGEGTPPELHELPTIVVMADEFADMIMVVGKKVEELIARIAQKARAAGIHLILATQRPSVDVITGLIKANVPTRIAFQVSSKVDSRTILDQQGAEQLLGNGDMLYLAPGTGVPIRVHGAFVSDDEVQRVVDEIKSQRQPDYLFTIDSMDLPNDPVLQSMGFSNGSDSDDEQDALYDQAVAVVLETRRASVSGVQRRLKIGYNRAARLVEAMERAGLVSTMDGSGNREVLVPDHRDN